MKNVLITGGAGFIGSHLASKYVEAGHNVTVIDNLSTGSLKNIDHLKHYSNFNIEIADILDSSLVDKLVKGSEIVVHLALLLVLNML